MQRKGRRDGAGQDVEAVLDELYATPPSGFVARREELAAAARTAGRADDARRIHAARRPTLAAWAANLLLRGRPEESRRFLELGQALREAYRSLDADGVRELSEQRRTVVSALSRQAAGLAREAGHRLSDAAQQDVESTLRAVLADPDAAGQWATGRLESALTPPSTFPAGTPLITGARPTSPKPSSRSSEPSRAATPSSARAQAKARDDLADRRRRREELARARKAAKAAEHHLRDQRAAQVDADSLVQQAHDRHDRARRQVSAAEHHLRQAREELQQAEREEREAVERRQAAADALSQAEREAHEAAQEVERLTAPPG
ncbi:hypothetical protein [Streptomyces sp. ALI-76-A]|uniref:hypothetical protein n=1 Tax=Streptomyces sp. ALI-76-A TaxID=3025736 RepID=UPI00256F6216|nr:hypothetical protein [Streptomyces sp. ALI-76-A]MDL5205216.1 hypothetical protein [Streptomyces sp. ALI-76-A]